ncbi:MAG: hypothetical protein AB1696_22060 [Planctomycetota bacterium]
MRRFMFGIVVEIFFETLCFFIGEIVIYAVSFGRWKTSLQKGNQTPRRQIVTALIGLAVILLAIALVVWSLWPEAPPPDGSVSQAEARCEQVFLLLSGGHGIVKTSISLPWRSGP